MSEYQYYPAPEYVAQSSGFLCDLPLRFDSLLIMGLAAISVVIGATNKKVGLWGAPGWTWVASGGLSLGLGLLTAMTCPPVRPYMARNICKDKYGRDYFC
jgi:hypothetical protein